MKTFTMDVTRRVTIRIDETKLGPLMEDFNRYITDFGDGDEAYERHAKHIARLFLEGYEFAPGDFVEGYGLIADAGIDATEHNDIWTDVVEVGET